MASSAWSSRRASTTGGTFRCTSFYSYTYPEPAGFRERELDVPGASFDTSLGEFLLPYRAVREASDPESLLLAFLRATYRAGAEAGTWPQAGDAAVS